MNAGHFDAGVLLLIAFLDIVMLAIVGLQAVWRQRVIQMVVVAFCTVCFAILFVVTALNATYSYYDRGPLLLVAISLYFTTAGSAAALVYLIAAVTRSRNPRAQPAYVGAGHAGPPPVPSVSKRAEPIAPSYLGPPPVPAARLTSTGRMPLGVVVAIICVFAASILLKLPAFTQHNFHAPISFLIVLVIDFVMIAVALAHSKWPFRKVEFSILVVIVLVLAYFLAMSFYYVMMRFNYMYRYWPASFYFFQLLSVLRLGAAVTALFYSGQSAFGTRTTASNLIDRRPDALDRNLPPIP